MIKLKWEIIWTGGLLHLSGLHHLSGVPHLHVNRPLDQTETRRAEKNYFVFLCEYSGPFWGMFSNIALHVDEKSCVFEEGRHLVPTLPPPDPVSPHFSPPVIIQRHPLAAGFMKTAPAGAWRPHTSNWLNWSKYCQDEDWYWPVEISQLNSISRCLISPCKSLLDCNVFNFIYFDWSRSFWIRRWARLFVQGFCGGFFYLN